MNKTLFPLLLISLFFPISSLQAADPVPVQIPEEELMPDFVEESAPNQMKTGEKAFSILEDDSSESESAESTPAQFPVLEEIPAADPRPIAEEIPSVNPRPILEEIPAANPRPILEEIPIDEPQPIAEEIPAAPPRPIAEAVPSMDSGVQPIRSSSGLIPFNPSASVQKNYDSTPDFILSDPENFLLSVFQKYQFPYSFIHVEALHSNAEVQQLNNHFVQMQLPMMISFDTESFAVFQSELESALEIISSSFQNEVAQARSVQGRKMIREGILLNIPDGTGNYKSYALPKKCREVLAQYAAVVPVGRLTLYDENKNSLQNLFFPILYRDIVKAFPINLLEVYQSDLQTLRIYDYQNDSFMEFIQNEGKSFVISERFYVVHSYSASAKFIERQAKAYYLEPVFRRPDPVPQIPMMLEMQLPTTQFQCIRFMNCEIMTDQPGVAASNPARNFALQEKSQGRSQGSHGTKPEIRKESILTKADLKPAQPNEKTAPEEVDPAILMEPADEELPFILEEIPAQEAK